MPLFNRSPIGPICSPNSQPDTAATTWSCASQGHHPGSRARRSQRSSDPLAAWRWYDLANGRHRPLADRDVVMTSPAVSPATRAAPPPPRGPVATTTVGPAPRRGDVPAAKRSSSAVPRSVNHWPATTASTNLNAMARFSTITRPSNSPSRPTSSVPRVVCRRGRRAIVRRRRPRRAVQPIGGGRPRQRSRRRRRSVHRAGCAGRP